MIFLNEDKIMIYLINRIKTTDSGCWEFTGTKTHDGYGRFKAWNASKKKYVSHLAHRVSYYIFKEHFYNEEHVLHRCDNPPCIRPDHLFLGDNKINVADKMAKGRHAGQKQTHCKQGHEFTPDNTVPRSEGGKYCKLCRDERTKRWASENKKERAAVWRKYYYKNREKLNRDRVERQRRANANKGQV